MHIPSSETEPSTELTQQWGEPRHPQNGSGWEQEPSLHWTMSAHTSSLPSLTEARVAIPRDHLLPAIWHPREQGAVRQESTWGKEPWEDEEEEEEEGKKEENEEEVVPATEAHHPSAGADEQLCRTATVPRGAGGAAGIRRHGAGSGTAAAGRYPSTRLGCPSSCSMMA